MLNKKEILEPLNKEQKVVTKDYLGKMAVIAGAGSGKTKTIVSRAAYMIADGIIPSSILIFTFTKKAANELKTRVKQCIGEKSKGITVKTYHAFGRLLLTEFYSYTGRDKNFKIIENIEKNKILGKIMEDLKKEYQQSGTYDVFLECKFEIIAGNIAKKISKFKEELIIAKKSKQNFNYNEIEKEIYYRYQQQLIQDSLYDMDDLIFEPVLFLKRFPEIKNKINKRYHFIIADEVQDSSKRDIEFISLLGSNKNNICLVGDDSQSIYAFRGADISYFIDYLKINEYKIKFLEINYRSTDSIVKSANAVIKNNKKQIKKVCYTKNDKGCKVIHRKSKDSDTQIFDLIASIASLVKMGKYKYKDIAVLYRTRASLTELKKQLLKNKIPHKVNMAINGQMLSALEELLECIQAAYMDDEKEIEKILNTQVLESTILPLSKEKFWNEYKLMRDIILKYRKYDYSSKYMIEMLNKIMKNTHFLPSLKEPAEFGYTKKKLLERVAKKVSSYESLENFAVEMYLAKEKEDEDNVYIGTIHSSKGLEWPVVFIIDAVEGILPCKPKKEEYFTEEDKEEERRIFYVGLTRAKRIVILLSHSYTMPSKKNSMGEYRSESRFISEINKEWILEV